MKSRNKKPNKWILISFFFALIAILALISVYLISPSLIYSLFKEGNSSSSVSAPAVSPPAAPSPPESNPPPAQPAPAPISQPPPAPAAQPTCPPAVDSYAKPDFTQVKSSLEKEAIVQKIPSSGSIRLGFYHFVGDCRIWDKYYYLSKASVSETAVPFDIDLWISSNYAKQIGQQDLCTIVQNSKASGDFGSDTSLSAMSLAWKYSSLLSYRSCLGI